ncbi:MAG: 23S rRNA (pseudouridine(1915)-N(3))-methyltransferase RlmH [Alphaproteobacteria bacterium]|nr:23S rRNA (pseudouridine(1915)-N(3))-methyltransferase RlmH [Alphaproteobacteria bacterium]
MRLHVLAIGRGRKGPERDLWESYAGRIRWSLELRELEEKRPLPAAERVARESELLLGAVPDDAKLVALDEAGRTMTSEAFATRLGAWRDDGIGDIAFVIGGADGLGDEVRRRADLVLAFGEMTWPHLVVRGMLAEQIYRAQQILAGHPYHRN